MREREREREREIARTERRTRKPTLGESLCCANALGEAGDRLGVVEVLGQSVDVGMLIRQVKSSGAME